MEFSKKEKEKKDFLDINLQNIHKLDNYDIPIEFLNFSKRSLNALKRVGLDNYEKIIKLNIIELSNIKNLGTRSVEEIVKIVIDKEKIKKICEIKNLNKNFSKDLIKDDITLEKIYSVDANNYTETSIDVLGLSVRTYNALSRIKIRSIAELIKLTNLEIRNIRNLGNGSIDEIYKNLNEFFNVKAKDLLTVEKIEYIIKQNINDERIINILKMRNDGKTLENIAKEENLTRERIRQIENKATEKLIRALNVIKISDYLYDLSEYGYLAIETIEKNIIFKNSFIFQYVLKSSAIENVVYNKEFDCLFINDGDELYEKHLNALPELIKKDRIDDILRENYLNKDLSIQFGKRIIEKTFFNYEKYYSKSKMNSYDMFSFLLNKYYPKGIKITNIVELKKFAILIDDYFGTSYSNSLRALQARVSGTCILVDRGTYIANVNNKCFLTKKMIDKIDEYIINYDHNIIPLYALYDKFKQYLNIDIIYNRYIFQSLLKNAFWNKYSFSRDYLFKDGKRNYDSEIINYIAEKKGIITKVQIEDEFYDVKPYVLQRCLNSNLLINMTTGYIHRDNLNISKAEINNLKIDLENILNDDETYHIDNLYADIIKKENGVLYRNGFDKPDKLFYLLKAYFSEDYNFRRPYIAKKNIIIERGYDKFLNEILRKGEVNIKDIRGISESYYVQLNSILGFVNDNIDSLVFKNGEKIISIKQANLDTNAFENIDDVLDDFIGEKNITSLYRFQLFAKLPEISLDWNYWLLYCIIKLFSEKYDSTTTSNHFNDAVPLIFKRNINISNDEKAKYASDVPLNLEEELYY